MGEQVNTTALLRARAELIVAIAAGKITPQIVARVMTSAFGGTDASGAWEWRTAYDVMQSAALEVAQGKFKAGQGPLNSAQGLQLLSNIASNLPTETRRSERQMQLQQFSTSMEWGWVAALAAQVNAGDVVLEPSAGTGCLARIAQMGAMTAKGRATDVGFSLNEIDPVRCALLSAGQGGEVSSHDGEFIDDLLEGSISPSVVLMNPPFASSASRSGDSTIALRHVLSAAKRLSVGGRLVAIVPPSVSKARGGALWERLCAEVTPIARLILPRSAFARMGTTVETHLLIAEKRLTGSGDGAIKCPSIAVSSPAQACEVLERILPVRMAITAPRGVHAPIAKPQNAMNVQANAAGTTQVKAPLAKRKGMLLPKAGGAGASGSAATARASTALVPLAFTEFATPRSNEAISDVYARYAPQRLLVEAAQPHPTTLVESLAMASVAPPLPKVAQGDIRLPKAVITEGLMSDAQLETLIMAETAFGCDLPGRFSQSEDHRLMREDDNPEASLYRKGYFLGDGTGCGKGRQVAGLILAGWGAGRRKAVWVSRSATLVEDARRDWSDLGGAPTDIHALSKWSTDESIQIREGILFVTYATLRAVAQSGATRLEQVLEWLGSDFDGVIAFDEAHAMQNAGGSVNTRGNTGPSQQGLAGLRLQHGLPRARVLYVSATGATEVSNLAYAGRLGLWGSGVEYPFASREAFVTAMEAGGVAAMEVVARDLKALGLYTARALSFEGVEYDVLEHELTPDQVTIYDTWATAFRTIHQNLQAALAATGVSNPDGSSEQGTGAAKVAAMSAFESTKQRFFGHLLQGIKVTTVIAEIRSDIEAGWAPVVQIVSTGEALLKRRIETLSAGEELTEAALTPKEYVLSYLENAFPITQMQLVEQEDGSFIAVPLQDENGARVISREALALRDAAMEELMLLAPVPSALDQLIWAFGVERVAEVTGRSQRPVKDRDGRLRIERRAASANSAETHAFMSGDKDILIFSDAGGTGRSYQAAKTAQNQRRRRHYLLEPGWRADNAIQGLGRTHRAAQVSAPFFRVCTTNVHGEKRFTSTIARRLDTLGALTKGQRETASQGMFRAQDNLESAIARGCLRGMFRDIATGRDAPMPMEVFTDWTGLKLCSPDGVLLDELPPIQRFLNHVLALPIEMQNTLFASFMERIATATERARAAGTLDVGLEQLRGDRITAGEAEPLRVDSASGAVTSLVPLTIETALSYSTAQEVQQWWPDLMAMENTNSGKVALIARKPRHVFDEAGEGGLERRVQRPVGQSWMSEDKFTRSGWEAITSERFAQIWDAEVATLPDIDEQRMYLLTGLILPIWRDIPGMSTRIYRTQTECGTRLLGRALTPEDAGVLKGKFVKVDATDPSSVYRAVAEGRQVMDLGKGLTLAKRRVAGNTRLEITGADRAALEWLRSLGCFTEIHQFILRVFVPFGEGVDTAAIVASIMGEGEMVLAA